MGGFMIAEVVKRLSENRKKLDFGLYVVNSVQEETVAGIKNDPSFSLNSINYILN